VALVSCEVEVAGGLAVALRHALAAVAAKREIVLRRCMPLVGCEAEPAGGLAVVLQHALARVAAKRVIVLSPNKSGSHDQAPQHYHRNQLKLTEQGRRPD
jgi:hypothetical protein